MNNMDDNIRKAAEQEFSQLKGIFDATELQNMKEAAKATYTLFTNFMEAGFDTQQAIQLTIGIIQSAVIHNVKGSEK